MMKIAFYKGTIAENPKAKLFDIAVCWWTKGRFSHCELILEGPDTAASCVSSSFRDHGVRVKTIDLTTGRWVIEEIKGDEAAVLKWFTDNAGKPYDIPGLFGFVLPFRTNVPDWWFCSEACSEAMGLAKSWIYHPNKLHEYVMSPANGLLP